ncbi:MAG: FecR domain-containing protein [Chloroflexi bacterium]|nr:FecR domain-containing protein [Chloroflexota bacterium]
MYIRKGLMLMPIFSLLLCSALQAQDEGILHFLVGNVRVDGQKATPGMKIKQGATVETGPESIAEIRYGHETGLRIREKSRVKIDRPASAYRILLAHGTLLSLVRHKTDFEVLTPITTAGVRGTTLFVHVPDDTTAYVCTCNGKVELRDGDRSLKTVSAAHHEPYRIQGRPGHLRMEAQGMLIHTDVEIFEQRYRLEQEESEK